MDRCLCVQTAGFTAAGLMSAKSSRVMSGHVVLLHLHFTSILADVLRQAYPCSSPRVFAGHVDFHARRYMGLFEFMRPHERHQDIKTPSDQRTLVIPVDDSQHSLRAVEWAVQNVYKAESDELHLLSVVPRVAGPYPAEVGQQGPPKLCHFYSNTSFLACCTEELIMLYSQPLAVFPRVASFRSLMLMSPQHVLAQ